MADEAKAAVEAAKPPAASAMPVSKAEGNPALRMMGKYTVYDVLVLSDHT